MRPSPPHGCWSQGQIALEEARFYIACELIFAGTFHCPRCETEIVLPLAQWLSHTEAAEAATAAAG